jgi:hypothetical protein
VIRLVAADSNQVIYAGSIQYGSDVNGLVSGVVIEAPEDQRFKSSKALRAEKGEAVERLVRGIEAISMNIADKMSKDGTAKVLGFQNTEFYSEAEAEISSNTYDKHLWVKALVETEGDETKRKARYIELRANQLYIENGGSISTTGLDEQTVSEPTASGIDISGTYVSDRIRSSWTLQHKKRLSITLKQENNSFKGHFINSLDGPIYGAIDKGKMEFEWQAGNCSYGVGNMTITPDGSALEGVLICRSQGLNKYEVVFHPI